MEQQQAQPDQECVLIYDGRCRMCVTAKKGIEELRPCNTLPSVRFIPYQSEEAAGLLGSDYRPGRPDVAFLLGPDGQIRRGLDAFLPLLPGLPGGRYLLALIRVPFMKSLAALVYRVVARYRYRWFGEVQAPHS
ncbi:MAG: thiol-disulfide oxidoreductase DCC family protein [Nitrospiraceae bacterium]